MKAVSLIIISLFIFTTSFAQDSSQTFLSLRNTGVEKFQQAYPKYDGRGTIILVLDTGVDMGVDGLITTSTGEVKVIDVQDFTGQGDISFFEAEIEEDDDTLYFVNEEYNLKVAGANNLPIKSIENDYYIGVLKESLWMNSGSRADDINGNGSKNDLFHFVTFETNNNGEKFWVVLLDTDFDGDISDETPLRNYKENFDSFTIPNEKGLPKFTLALNIFPERRVVSFVFDDGSHGTHCAGISAGNRIGNNEIYGIAPGAKVIGLKLGNNNFAGGATVAESMKKSYIYADKISKEMKEPCIINMSFGIGSEIEGLADIELFLEELVKDNPYLYIATSNGNNGPGISTSGMPSASDAIFSSGAVLAQEVGNDLYGTTLNRDIILHFSSRGGEVAKPDVVAPGACVSTVPNFSNGDVFWGTSMASPYSAGVMAVLLGAANAEYPDVKIPSKLLYKVLRESATPMEDYECIDQGSGLINIEAAYSLLKDYINKNEIANFETYTITSLAPNMPNNSAPNLYIRDAGYLNGTETFSFNIKRDNFNNTDKFYRLYNLNSNFEWLKIIQKKVHIRNDQGTVVNVKIADSILTKPGMYNALIDAVRADKSKMPEFSMMATFIVPYHFNVENNYSVSFENEKVKPGLHKRYFLRIPNGTSNLNISVSSGKNEYTNIRYYFHDPDGTQKLFGYLNAKSEDDKRTDYINNLEPGVYEFVVLGQFTSDQESTFNLDFEIEGISIIGHSIKNNGELKIANYFTKLEEYNLEGKVLGYQKSYVVEMNGEKTHQINFKLNESESKKSFEVTLSKEDFNKVTDFALMIYDKDGKALRAGGLNNRNETITITKSNKDEIIDYKFIMIPGFAHEPSNIKIILNEKTYFSDAPEMSVKNNKRSNIKLYPNTVYLLNCDYKLPEISIPEENKYFGAITFKSVKTKDVKLTKILNINN
jgi:subtilisin family serine protease